MANANGTPNSQTTTTLDGCVRHELSARTALEASWSGLTPDLQSHCMAVASFAGDGSYALLQSCIAKAIAAQALDRGEAVGN